MIEKQGVDILAGFGTLLVGEKWKDFVEMAEFLMKKQGKKVVIKK